MDMLQFCIMSLIVYLMLYILVDRICKCVEHRHLATNMASSFEVFLKEQSKEKSDEDDRK